MFAAGRRSYTGGGVCWIGVGAPPRGEALGLRSGLWDGRHSRRCAAPTRGGGVCWAGVGAPPRGEALRLRSGLRDSRHCSRRGAAPTRAVAFAGLVLEPCLGAKLWGCARDCGMAAIVRGGAPLLHGRRRLLDRCGSPASGRSFGVAFGVVGWPPLAAGRRSTRRASCRIGYPLPVRQTSILPRASFRFAVTRDTLAFS